MPARVSSYDSASSLTLFLNCRMSMPLRASTSDSIYALMAAEAPAGFDPEGRIAFWKFVPVNLSRRSVVWDQTQETVCFGGNR